MIAPPTYHRERVREGPLPLSTQIYQGLGALPDTYMNFAFGSLLLFYYNQVLGLPAARASFALMLALVIDAIADPLVGSVSDNFRSRLGRRHPFMYASALPLGAALTLTFLPPAGLSQDGLCGWLLACAIATRVAMSFFLVPWGALYAELTNDYAERSAVVMWRYLAGWTGGVAFTFAVFTFVFPSSPEYTPGHLNPHAYATFAPLLGGLVAAAAFLTTHLTVREIPYLLQPKSVEERRHLASFASELRLAARNRDFLLLVAGIFVSAAIAGTGGALDIYMTTYFWGLRPEDLRWFGITIVGAVAAFVLVSPLQARIEKHHLLAVCALFNLVNGFIVVGLRFAGVLPKNGDPLLLPILIANSIVRVAADTLLGIMFASMVADTLDAQELATGRRQEGLFSGALSFAGKATSGFGVMLGGLVLEYVILMPIGAKPATLDTAVLHRIGIVAGFVLPLFYLLPISGIRFYRITRARHAEIRAKLAERHGEASAELNTAQNQNDRGTRLDVEPVATPRPDRTRSSPDGSVSASSRGVPMNPEHCLVEREGRVLVVTLNRPEAKNALSGGMLAGMYRAWRMLDEDPELRVAILTGRGDVFCAGADLKSMGAGETDDEFMKLMSEVPDIHWQALLRCNRPTKPIICAVEGFALAGGTEILQGTDIRVAAEDAVFGITEARRGLFPLGGSSVRLRRQIPYTLAAEILLTGRHVTAQEALRFGLVGRVVPKGQALAEAKKIAADICDNGPLSIRALMHMLREVDESYSEADAMAKELEYGSPIFGTRDAREGMKAFKEKRKPVYTGE